MERFQTASRKNKQAQRELLGVSMRHRFEIYCYKEVYIVQNKFSSSSYTNKEIQVTTSLTRQINIRTG
jgi:hypothetical protein